MKASLAILFGLALASTVAPLHASLIGSATVTDSQINSTTFQYNLTLNDLGTTTIGTFWFSWVPGANFMPVSPTNITSPASWNPIVTNGGAADGFAIQWTASSAAADLAAGQSLSGFSFDSTATPAQMAGLSSFHPGEPVETSFVYSGVPFSDAGFQFVATNAGSAVPEPSTSTLGAIGAAMLLLVRWRKTRRVPGRCLPPY